MPRPEQKGCYSTTYFSTPEEKQFWDKFAEDRDRSLNSMVIHGLETLRSLELEPHEIPVDHSSELAEARRELKLKDKLLQRYEAELYRIRHEGFQRVGPAEGSRQFDLALVKLLQQGRTLGSQAILEGLGIDPNDAEATKLVWNQLERLQQYGLAKNMRTGWKWIR